MPLVIISCTDHASFEARIFRLQCPRRSRNNLFGVKQKKLGKPVVEMNSASSMLQLISTAQSYVVNIENRSSFALTGKGTYRRGVYDLTS